ncbi:KRAB-A domain-containing protein 2, partial [Trichinella nativa]
MKLAICSSRFVKNAREERARKLPKSLVVKPLKFCILSPLMLKRAEEVASKLLESILTFGAPIILQSDNCREFSSAIIAELKTCWPELKLVTGRPRHPQSQGAVERLNGVVQDKLAIWMRENGCKRWSMGLKF